MAEPFSILRIDARDRTGMAAFDELRRKLSPDGNIVSERGRKLTLEVFGQPLTPQQVVERICDEVRQNGDASLLHYCRTLDGKSFTADDLRVPIELMAEAHREASPNYLAAIRHVRSNIESFQNAIKHRDVTHRPAEGIVLQQRYVPLQRIGICVPGGAAAYPSTVLMIVVPALAAGVDEIAVVAPPTALGAYNPEVLAVCYELGLREVYAVGGAQAIAALAYGTPSIRKVDKIVGPGNLFVALAKKRVFGEVDIDSIAGPSEIAIVADGSVAAEYTAADMLAQAEHAPGSSVLISWSTEVFDRVDAAIRTQVANLERAEWTIDSLQAYGAMILVRDEAHACETVDRIAPEHLHLATNEPRRLLERIRNSGATFLGAYSPVALGDYAAGPSHVLPTGGTARWASGLSVNDFLRSSSVIEYSREQLRRIGDTIELLANLEGLTAHRKSVAMRNEVQQ